MIINAQFMRKENTFDTEDCVVDKVIELSAHNFNAFRNNMMNDYGFLTENIHVMGFDEDGYRHGVLILGENCDDGILVDSQGSTYARYSAFIPNARQLLPVLQYESLRDFNTLMSNTVDEAVERAIKNNDEGYFTIKETDLPSQVEEPLMSFPVFGAMISERDEFMLVETFSDEVAVQTVPHLSNSLELQDENLTYLSSEEVDVMLARHTLWLNENEYGKQADFSNCVVRDYDFSNKKMLSASLGNGVFSDCKFNDSELCFASAENAIFKDCSFIGITADEMEIVDSRLFDCGFKDAMFCHADFNGSSFNECDFFGATVNNCNFENTELIDCDARIAQGDLTNVWSDDQGMTMG